MSDPEFSKLMSWKQYKPKTFYLKGEIPDWRMLEITSNKETTKNYKYADEIIRIDHMRLEGMDHVNAPNVLIYLSLGLGFVFGKRILEESVCSLKS